MNEKEISEIRRRYKEDKHNLTVICGCYVNEKHEIIAEFRTSPGMLPVEESEKYLAIFKRTLSGRLGKNLVDVSFPTNDVLYGESHKLLTALRETALGEESVKQFYTKVIDTLPEDENYLILLTHEVYDIPSRDKNGERDGEDSDAFPYFICSVCPVKRTKPALSYCAEDKTFKNSHFDRAVSMPEFGFMFPAYESRGANIYGALYYTRQSNGVNPFADAVFSTPLPMPADEQKELFCSILSETLDDECSLAVAQTVHDRICGIIEEHKANHDETPLSVSKHTVKGILQSCGVTEEHASEFEKRYDEAFGSGTELPPRNIVGDGKTELKTPDVVIRVNPERSDLLETRVINGSKFILIRADDTVEVNGVCISIKE